MHSICVILIAKSLKLNIGIFVNSADEDFKFPAFPSYCAVQVLPRGGENRYLEQLLLLGKVTGAAADDS